MTIINYLFSSIGWITAIGIIGALLGILSLYGSMKYTKASERSAEEYTNFNTAIILANLNDRQAFDELNDQMNADAPEGSIARLSYKMVMKLTSAASMNRYLSEGSPGPLPYNEHDPVYQNYLDYFDRLPEDLRVRALVYLLDSNKASRIEKYKIMVSILQKGVDNTERALNVLIVAGWNLGVYVDQDTKTTPGLRTHVDYHTVLQEGKKQLARLAEEQRK